MATATKSDFDEFFTQVDAPKPAKATKAKAPKPAEKQAPKPAKADAAVVDVEVKAKPKSRPPVEGKVTIAGGPGVSTVYPRGYVKIALPNGGEMWGYLEDFTALVEFTRNDDAVTQFLSDAIEAGLRNKHEG